MRQKYIYKCAKYQEISQIYRVVVEKTSKKTKIARHVYFNNRKEELKTLFKKKPSSETTIKCKLIK